MHTPPPPNENDYILRKLAGFTSLFNPGNSWKEEQLDDLDEQDEQRLPHPDETRPATK